MLMAFARTALSLSLPLAAFAAWQGLPTFLVRESDPQLRTLIADTSYRGEPYSGIAYELWEPWNLAKFMIFWKGHKFGTERHWYRDGRPRVAREYRDGLPHGEWKQWYPSGKIKSLKTYRRGQAEGEFWAWYENGRLAEFQLVKGEQDITQKIWIPDGSIYRIRRQILQPYSKCTTL